MEENAIEETRFELKGSFKEIKGQLS